MSFGAFFGSDDIGTRSFTSPFSVGISNAQGGLSSPISVPLSLPDLYVTIKHIDDIFDLEVFGLSDGSSQYGGQFVGFDDAPPNPTPVPVPAAIRLFGTALIGFIGISRRTKVA